MIERESLRVEARTLLTLKSPDGVTRGLVLDNAGAPPENFEFTRRGDILVNRIPFQIPQGFHWKNTPSGLAPDASSLGGTHHL